MDVQAIMDNSSELPEVVKHHFRQKLLDGLTLNQQVILHQIETTKSPNRRHGARGFYKDPVQMHKAREMQKFKSA